MGLASRDLKTVCQAAAITALVGATPALALTGDELDYTTGPSVRIYHDPGTGGLLSPFTRRPELDQFQARYGGRWEAYWDALTNTPAAVWGSGLPLLAPGESRSSEA